MRIRSLMFCAACAALVLGGCASVPKGDVAQDAALKRFMPRANVAGIYVYRKEGAGGFAAMEVHVDGRKIGSLSDNTFLFVEVMPGTHVITGRLTGQLGERPVPGLEINTLPSKLYYVKHDSRLGGLLTAGSTLTRVDVLEAQPAIRKTTLAAEQADSAP